MSRRVVKAEMAGTILSLGCGVGDVIAAGQELMLMESMKMEIPVLTPAAGSVVELLVAPGESVAEGQDLAVVEA